MKPMLFNTEMVKAIMEGRKTVTGRVLKLPFEVHPNGFITKAKGNERLCPYEPPFQTGDILYVRETWHKYTKRIGKGENCRLAEFYGYKASIANSEDANEPWKPSIHMPKEAARIFLRVKSVHAERLQDIDDKGAYLEGAGELNAIYQIGARVCEFVKIWNSTIKPADLNTYGWEANPWVWVIEFEQITKEQAYELEKKKA